MKYFNSRFSETIDTSTNLIKTLLFFCVPRKSSVPESRFPDSEISITSSVENYESKFSNFNEFINSE